MQGADAPDERYTQVLEGERETPAELSSPLQPYELVEVMAKDAGPSNCE